MKTDGEDKDILKKLHAILKEKYADEPNSRTIIFIRTRLSAAKLAEHLNEIRILGSSRAVGFVASELLNTFKFRFALGYFKCQFFRF